MMIVILRAPIRPNSCVATRVTVSRTKDSATGSKTTTTELMNWDVQHSLSMLRLQVTTAAECGRFGGNNSLTAAAFPGKTVYLKQIFACGFNGFRNEVYKLNFFSLKSTNQIRDLFHTN